MKRTRNQCKSTLPAPITDVVRRPCDKIPLNTIHPTTTYARTRPRKSIGKKPQRKRKAQPFTQEKEVKKARKTRKYPTTMTRNSPKMLSDLIKGLSPTQRQWIEAAGFGSLLQFSLTRLPHKIGYMLVTSYNHDANQIQFENGCISICDEDVQCILGLPRGLIPVHIEKKPESTQTKIEWCDQFPEVVDKNMIPTKNVCEKISDSKEADHLFKLNFLVAMSSILIRSRKTMYVNQSLLNFMGDVDNCAKYNWCAYLIKNLKESKPEWGPGTFFTGPLTFLILLYVDRVVVDCEPTLERVSPAFLNWKDVELRQREHCEIKMNLLGKGALRTRFSSEAELREEERAERTRFSSRAEVREEERAERKRFSSRAEVREDESAERTRLSSRAEVREEERAERTRFSSRAEVKEEEIVDLRRCAHKLIEKLLALGKAEREYKKIFNICATKHDEDVRVKEINDSIVEIYKLRKDGAARAQPSASSYQQCSPPSTQDPPTPNIETTTPIIPSMESDEAQPPTKSERERLSQDLATPNREQSPWRYSQEILSDNLRTVEKIEKSAKGSTKVPPTTEPATNFLEQEEDGAEDASHEVSTLDIRVSPTEKNDEATPTTLQSIEKCDPKLVDTQKSFYEQRVTEIDSSLTKEEILLYEWVEENTCHPLEIIFEDGQYMGTMDDFKSLIADNQVNAQIINLWCSFLNECEKQRAAKSPLRFFCSIDVTHGTLADTDSGTSEQQCERFAQNMLKMLERYPQIRLQEVDMIFFPIDTHEHFYIVCYNLKYPRVEILDNGSLGDARVKYGEYPGTLHKWFVQFLKTNDHPRVANIEKTKAVRRLMKWRTKENGVDSGVFVMRHMETYKGEVQDKWKSGFEVEEVQQKKQIDMLRKKYLHTILASRYNFQGELLIKTVVEHDGK